MADNTKTRRIIKRNLKKHGFIPQNDGLKSHKISYENGWGKITFSFGKYHDKFLFNILRRINGIDDDWDHFAKKLNLNNPKESFTIVTHIQSVGKHFEEYNEFVEPFNNTDKLLRDSNKFDEAFSNVMENCISPFLIKVGDLTVLNNLMNNPLDKWENIHDIIAGGTSVYFKKVLLAYKVGYEQKENIEYFVKDVFNEKLNVKGSKEKYKLYMNTLDEIINFYKN